MPSAIERRGTRLVLRLLVWLVVVAMPKLLRAEGEVAATSPAAAAPAAAIAPQEAAIKSTESVLEGPSGHAGADPAVAVGVDQPAAPAPAEQLAPSASAPKPAPYSLPWQLRPVVAASVVRSDTASAFFEDAASGNHGTTTATTLLASYKVAEGFAPLARIGAVNYAPPTGPSKTVFVNPVVGGTYAIAPAKNLRVAFFLGFALPLGQGGGDSPDPATAAAVAAGVLARSAMDNAMFAVNYFTTFPGVGVAYVGHGLTVQAEATVLELVRARGEKAKSSADGARTNFTSGLHVGYFVVPMLSLGAELRYQRWLANDSVPSDAPTRDTLTFALGPRLHVQLADKIWFRPGLAYARGIDDPMSNQSYNVVQLDLPAAF